MEKEAKEKKIEMVENARVKAIARGHDGLAVREVGEVFNYTGGLGSWMEVIDGKTAVHNDVSAANYGQVKHDAGPIEQEEDHKKGHAHAKPKHK